MATRVPVDPTSTTPGDRVKPDRASAVEKPLTKAEKDKVGDDIAGALLGMNAMLLHFMPAFALDQSGMDIAKIGASAKNEIEKLTDALAAEVEHSSRLRKWVRRAGAVSPHLQLLIAVGGIVLSRLQAMQEAARITAERIEAENHARVARGQEPMTQDEIRAYMAEWAAQQQQPAAGPTGRSMMSDLQNVDAL